ncbi:ubiquitin carboxyl-terminal hydrolase 24 [Plakobranchus ocellatus]|uniref:Ubiquitin carboxyl-terminal hydrolase 24 n=1 Tax=Plakobranchus ocellatus TaxID=259542 RepID=A0AAV3XUQ8_9GAST|nr:ubiquitin carboxyl-terminal hydrolase 24 [Plakobranchus ocellatus]
MNETNATTALEDFYFYDDKSAPAYLDGFETMVGVVPRVVYLGVIYFILIFGLIGNVSVLFLMHNRDFQNLSYPVYVRTLGVVDSIFLITVCIEDILDHQFKKMNEFMTSSVAFCKIWSFALNVTRLLSPWLIVSLTCDRFVAVVFPLKRAVLCSRRTALITCSMIVGLVLGESLFYAILSRPVMNEEDFELECDLAMRGSVLNYVMFRALFHETTLPCTVILFLNIGIIITVRRSLKFRAATGSKQPGKEKSSSMDKVTLSLTAVSLMAFICLLPISLLQVIEYSWFDEMENYEEHLERQINITEEELQRMNDLHVRAYKIGNYWPLLNLFFLVNFGQNFYVMIITGPKYRQVFERIQKKNNNSSSSSSSSS